MGSGPTIFTFQPCSSRSPRRACTARSLSPPPLGQAASLFPNPIVFLLLGESVESGAAPSPQFCELSLPGSRSRPASSPLTTGRSRETITYGFLLDVSWVCLRIDDRGHGRMGKSRHLALCALGVAAVVATPAFAGVASVVDGSFEFGSARPDHNRDPHFDWVVYGLWPRGVRLHVHHE